MCKGMTGARIGLLVSNLLLMLISLLCIGGGAVLILGRAAYGTELDWLEEDLTAAVTKAGKTDLDVSELDLRFITLPLGVALLIFGVLILAICILGIIAASGQFYKFVIVYVVLLCVLYFAQIVVIICAYVDRSPFNKTVKKLLKTSLESFTGIEGEDSITLGWNAFMNYKKCCGVDSYNDFSVATGWVKTFGVVNLETPIMCCMEDQLADPPACANLANRDTQTYYNRGCYEHMWDHVTSNTSLIIFIVFLIVLLQFLCIFFAVWIICFRKSLGPTKIGHYDRYY